MIDRNSQEIEQILWIARRALETWNTYTLMILYGVIESIKGKIESLLSPNRTNKVILEIEGILERIQAIHPQWHHEFESMALSIQGETKMDIQPLQNEGILVSYNDSEQSEFIQLSSTQTRIFELIIRHNNSLTVKPETRAQLEKQIIDINQKIQHIGIQLSLEGTILFCEGTEREPEANTEENDIIQEETIDLYENPLCSSLLDFGNVSYWPVLFQVYPPKQVWRKIEFPCKIGKKQCLFPNWAFQLFLKMLEHPEKTIQANYQNELFLRSILFQTEIELIGNGSSGLRLALRHKKLDHLHFYSGTKNGIPHLESILQEKRSISQNGNRSQKKDKKEETLSGEEKLDSMFWEFHIQSHRASWRWKKRIFSLTINENPLLLTPSQFQLFRTIISPSGTFEISRGDYPIYRTLLLRIKDIANPEFLEYFEAQKSSQRKKRILQETKHKETKIEPQKKYEDTEENTLSEEEKLDITFWDYRIKSIKANGRWKKRLLFLSISGNEISLTPFQYQLFKNIVLSNWDFEIKKQVYPIYRNLLKRLWEYKIWAFQDFFESHRRKKEVKEKSERNIPRNEQEVSILNFPEGKIISMNIEGIKVQSKSYFQKGRWTYFEIEIWEKSFILPDAQYILLKKCLESQNGSVRFSPGEYQSYLRFKEIFQLEKILLQAIERKREKRIPQENREKAPPQNLKPEEGKQKKISPEKKEKEKIQKTKKEIPETSNTSLELFPREKISLFVRGDEYRVSEKFQSGQWVKYRISIKEYGWNIQEAVLTEKEFELFLLFSQHIGKAIKLAPCDNTLLQRLKTKLPRAFRNAIWEWHYLWEYTAWLHEKRANPWVSVSLNPNDYAFENIEALQESILALFLNNKEAFYSSDDLAHLFSKFASPEEVKKQFLLAKANYNKENLRIIETLRGWCHIPEKENMQKVLLFETEIHYSEIHGLFLSTEWKIIFQHKNLGNYVSIKNRKIKLKVSPKNIRSLEALIRALRWFLPYISINTKTGDIGRASR